MPKSADAAYDAMEGHRWYACLEPTVDVVVNALRPGATVVDYACGTGILARRLLPRLDDVRYLLVDVDDAFLRAALERLRDDTRVAFRLLEPADGRLPPLDAVVAALDAPVDAVVTTNAIHLFDALEQTLSGWRRSLADDGWVHAQSGEIDNPAHEGERWLITDFVARLRESAISLTRSDARFSSYRAALDDPMRMDGYERVYRSILKPPRSVATYLDAFAAAKLAVEDVSVRTIEVGVAEWLQAAKVYHDLVAWIGGTEAVDGVPPSAQATAARHALLDAAAAHTFGEREVIPGSWTYITALAGGVAS